MNIVTNEHTHRPIRVYIGTGRRKGARGSSFDITKYDFSEVQLAIPDAYRNSGDWF